MSTNTFTTFNGVRASVKFLRTESTTPDGSNWDHNVWSVTLTTDGRRMRTNYMTGLGYSGGDLSASDILESLVSDAQTVTYAEGFEEWANDLGYDEDSRQAEKIYNAVVRQTKRLQKFLGDRYDEFLALDF